MMHSKDVERNGSGLLYDDILALFWNYEGEYKYVTNGSKAVVMDVIDFLCASLGSSTVQLHDSLGNKCASSSSEAGFSSQIGDRV
jgi:hypothetical protein